MRFAQKALVAVSAVSTVVIGVLALSSRSTAPEVIFRTLDGEEIATLSVSYRTRVAMVTAAISARCHWVPIWLSGLPFCTRPMADWASVDCAVAPQMTHEGMGGGIIWIPGGVVCAGPIDHAADGGRPSAVGQIARTWPFGGRVAGLGVAFL